MALVVSGRIIILMSQDRLFHLDIEHDPVPLLADAQGAVRVGGTRVPLDTVIHAFLEGVSAEEIVDRYSALTLADVYSTIAYYLRHRAEVDAYLAERERHSEEVRAHVEARQGSSQGLRERLLARRDLLAMSAC